MTTMKATTVATPLGPFTMIAGYGAVIAAGFSATVEDLGRRLRRDFDRSDVTQLKDLGHLSAAVEGYFDGNLHAFDDIQVTWVGSPFQEAAWTAMRRIPAGTTLSYGQLAESLRLGSARSAGTACARNPVTILVPCHRVVRSGGELGGYLWGLDRKRWLLDHERRSASP
jgi:methylated-DNA-[protein]-cysteine S-methyltransferase